MNLVKIAEDLKDVPLQAVQAYMNGLNPEVPPYMAQAEMMRRQKAMEKQKLAEGAQGQMPSVKEQLEQAAGLMALQQQRQQQGLQQMGQQAQAQPMPVQQPIPQPNRQPEGGVAALDLPEETFAMAGGGIVGFQAGGYMPYALPELERDPRIARLVAGRGDTEAEEEMRLLPAFWRALQEGKTVEQIRAAQSRGLPAVMPAPPGNQAAPSAADEVSRLASRYPAPPQGPTTYTGTRLSPGVEAQYLAQVDKMNPEVRGFWKAYTARFPDAGTQRPAPPTGAGRGTTGAGRTTTGAGPGIAAPQPAPQPAPSAGLPAALPQSSAQQMSADLLKEVQGMEAPKVDLAAIGQQEQQLAQQTGLAGLAAQREAMRKQYEEATKDRAFETFLATMGGGARGFGGTGAAYLEAKKAGRDADLGFAKRMYELESAPVEKSYETQRSMLKEAQTRANEWAADQRKMGIEIKKADIDRRTQLELEELKQKDSAADRLFRASEGKKQRESTERVAGIYAGGRGDQGATRGAITEKDIAEERAKAFAKYNTMGYMERAELRKAGINNADAYVKAHLAQFMGAPAPQAVESSANTADPLGIR